MTRSQRSEVRGQRSEVGGLGSSGNAANSFRQLLLVLLARLGCGRFASGDRCRARGLATIGRRDRWVAAINWFSWQRGCRCAGAVGAYFADLLWRDFSRRRFRRRDRRVRVENRRLALRRAPRDRAHTDAVFCRAVLHANRIRVPGIGESAALVRAQSEVVHAHCHACLSYRVGELLVAKDHRHRNYGETGENKTSGQTDAN